MSQPDPRFAPAHRPGRPAFTPGSPWGRWAGFLTALLRALSAACA
jgi:hypothetical protein